MGYRRTQHVPHDALAQQCLLVLVDIEHRAVIVRDSEARFGVFDSVRQQLACLQVTKAQHPLPTAYRVFGPAQQLVVATNLVVAYLKEIMAGRECRTVDQHLLRRACLPVRTPRMDGVFLSLFEPRVVIEGPFLRWHGTVVLLHTRDNFVVELLFEALHRRHQGIAVFILGGEVSQHLRVLSLVVAHPVVRVLAGAIGRRHLVRLAGRHRRHRLRRGHGRLGRERHGGGTTGVGGETGKNTGNKQGAAEARGHRWCPVTGLPRKEGHGGLQVPKRRAV